MAVFTHSPRNSSHIKSLSYDDRSKAVTVTFYHDRLKEPVTETRKIPPDVFDAWVKWSEAGHSAGRYYHLHVKNFPLAEKPKEQLQ